MSKMDKILAGEHVVFPMSWDDLGTRKTAFADVFLSLLEKKGYKNPQSLKIKGAYAFEVTNPQGRQVKIGLKSAYDGWLNTAHKMVEAVDIVWVFSFRWTGQGEPSSMDVHAIVADDLLDLFNRIHKTRAKLGRQNDHTYIPVLDDTKDGFLLNNPNHYACSEGSLEQYADRIYTAPLVWSNKEPTGIVEATAQQKPTAVLPDPLQGIDDPIAVLKQLIAKRNNTSVDKVKVLIEA
jgi:hypothetical protein